MVNARKEMNILFQGKVKSERYAALDALLDFIEDQEEDESAASSFESLLAALSIGYFTDGNTLTYDEKNSSKWIRLCFDPVDKIRLGFLDVCEQLVFRARTHPNPVIETFFIKLIRSFYRRIVADTPKIKSFIDSFCSSRASADSQQGSRDAQEDTGRTGVPVAAASTSALEQEGGLSLVKNHSVTPSFPSNESSERVRMGMIQLLADLFLSSSECNLLSPLQKPFDGLQDVVTVIQYGCMDPYPKIKLETCSLARSFFGWMKTISIESITPQKRNTWALNVCGAILCGCLSHQHSKVRSSAIRCFRDIWTSFIETSDLLRAEVPAAASEGEPSVVDSQSDIGEAGVATAIASSPARYPILSQLSYIVRLIPTFCTCMQDGSCSVRKTGAKSLLRMLEESRSHFESCANGELQGVDTALRSNALCALVYAAADVAEHQHESRNVSVQCLIDIGALESGESDSDILSERTQVPLDNLPCPVWASFGDQLDALHRAVRYSWPFIIRSVTAELSSWKSSTRLCASRVLVFVFSILQSQSLELDVPCFRSLLDSLVRLADESDENIRSVVLLSFRTLGYCYFDEANGLLEFLFQSFYAVFSKNADDRASGNVLAAVSHVLGGILLNAKSVEQNLILNCKALSDLVRNSLKNIARMSFMPSELVFVRRYGAECLVPLSALVPQVENVDVGSFPSLHRLCAWNILRIQAFATEERILQMASMLNRTLYGNDAIDHRFASFLLLAILAETQSEDNSDPFVSQFPKEECDGCLNILDFINAKDDHQDGILFSEDAPDTVRSWTSTHWQQHAFFTLLRNDPGCIEAFPVVNAILCDAGGFFKDASMRLSVLHVIEHGLLESIGRDVQEVESDGSILTSRRHTIIAQLLQNVLIPNLQWRSGAVNQSLRARCVRILKDCFSKAGQYVTSESFASSSFNCVQLLQQNFDDDDEHVRSHSVLAMEFLIKFFRDHQTGGEWPFNQEHRREDESVWTSLLTQEEVKELYLAIAARFDDAQDAVRLHAFKCIDTLVNLWWIGNPAYAAWDVDGVHVKHLGECLLLHMDDQNIMIQRAASGDRG